MKISKIFVNFGIKKSKSFLLFALLLGASLLQFTVIQAYSAELVQEYDAEKFSEFIKINDSVYSKEKYIVIEAPKGLLQIHQKIPENIIIDFALVQVEVKYENIKLGDFVYQAPTLVLESGVQDYIRNPLWIRSEGNNWRVITIVSPLPKNEKELFITIRNSALSGKLLINSVKVISVKKDELKDYDYPVKWNFLLDKKGSIPIQIKSPPSETYKYTNKKLYGYNSRYYTKNMSVKELLNNKMVVSVQPIISRFPGGTISNFYHSKCDCLNPQDIEFFPEYQKSKWYKDLFNKMSEPDSLGQKEYAAWCKDNNIGTTLVLNPVLEKSADELIVFINNMKKHGYKVDLVEMGNELYGDGQRGTILPKPENYFQRISGMVKEIKNFYPEITIGVPFSTENWQWNKSILKEGIQFEGIILHLYATTSSIASVEEDKYLIDYPYNFVPDLLQKLRELVPNKKFWVTEWGIIDRPLYKRNNSHMGTMFSANMIISLMREKDVEAACFHSLFDPHFGLFRFLIDASNEKFLKPENISYQYEFWKTLRKLFMQYEKNAKLLIFENNGKQLEGHTVEVQAFSKSDKLAIILVNNSSKTYSLNNIKLQTFENITGFIHPDIGTPEYQEYLPPFSVVILEGKRTAFNIEMMSVPNSPKSLETKN